MFLLFAFPHRSRILDRCSSRFRGIPRLVGECPGPHTPRSYSPEESSRLFASRGRTYSSYPDIKGKRRWTQRTFFLHNTELYFSNKTQRNQLLTTVLLLQPSMLLVVCYFLDEVTYLHGDARLQLQVLTLVLPLPHITQHLSLIGYQN